VLARSLLSAHTILTQQDGEFVSLLEPPPEFQEAAAACSNVGTWPVLAGEPGRRDTAFLAHHSLRLSADRRKARDLFDGAEIDEILPEFDLTEEEKSAMCHRRTRPPHSKKPRLPPEHFMKLMAPPQPASRREEST
jgi:hydrogenase maturation protease